MAIDTANILALYQPLCMMQLLKTSSQVMPVPGGYFGVPWLVGIQDGEFSSWWSEWDYECDVITTEQTFNGVSGFKSWTATRDGRLYASRSGTLDFSGYFVDSESKQYKWTFTKNWASGPPGPGRVDLYNQYEVTSRQQFGTVATFKYLGRAADGMPYHFQTAANAQAWIDATAARDAAARPKTGAARDKKLASLLAYKARVQKSRILAADRAYLNADLKSKVLDMLLREINEISRRLALI
jgi:hypothetical protein